jgi:hypothetical protein
VCDTIHVVNVGQETCTVAEVHGCMTPPFSTDTSMTVEVLGPGEATEIAVCVDPAVPGSDTCSVTIVSNAWNSPTVVPVSVEIVTGVEAGTQLRIVSVEPNPFNPTVSVRFTLPSAMPVTAAVYSVAGARVRVLADEERFGAGESRLVWDGMTERGKPAASGVYFVRLETPVGVKVARGVMVK